MKSRGDVHVKPACHRSAPPLKNKPMSLAAELERALHYPLADQLPPPGGAIQIAPGVKWLRMVLSLRTASS